MAQEANRSQGPMLCTMGCGFYGNPRTDGMCSVCYKEHLQRQNASDRQSPTAVSPGAGGTSVAMTGVEVAAQAVSPVLSPPTTPPRPEPAPAPTQDSSLPELSSPSSTASPITSQPSPMTSRLVAMSLDPNTEEADVAATIERTALPEDKDAAQPGTSDPEVPKQQEKKKHRCFACRKKVGLTGFECRCGHLFCGMHRYSDKHGCPFDYRQEATERLRRENPVVVSQKIHKI